MFGHPTSGAVLTSGIRRVLFGAIVMAFTLAAVQVIAVSKLQREIDHWGWTSDIDAQRERLFSRSQDFLLGRDDTGMSDILAVFDDLQRTTLIDHGQARDDQNAERFYDLGEEARAHFERAKALDSDLIPLRERISESVNSLQALSGTWTVQIRAEEQRILSDSEQIDARSSEITDLNSALTLILLNATSLQQQVITVERLIGVASDDIIRSSVAALSASGLPTVCAAGEEESGARVCSPSVARVLAALDRLQQADASALSRNITATLQGLQGYIRAGQGRLDRLSLEAAEVLSEMRALRQRQAELRGLNSSISRINRILLDIEVILDRPLSTSSDLGAANDRMSFLISQTGVRMPGLLRATQLLEGDLDFITQTTRSISESWNALYYTSSQRIITLNAFGETMDTLSSEIAAHASKVRRETLLWVSLYASSFLVLAGVLVALTVGLVLLARRRFIVPLARVTNTILGLARGDLEQNLVLPERAFGFDRLGTALEQLRQEMVERHRLAERNEVQQKIIASNLEELERASKDMAWMAMHDPLTALANRRQADLDLIELAKSDEASPADFCVMQVDIDRFKSVNDTLGHAAGDFVLKQVSEILKDCAGKDANCYRIGGDEFLVVLHGDYSVDYAAVIAEQMIGGIEAPQEFNGHRCHVGASIGIAMGRDADFDAMQCVINADMALYEVKRTGRGTFKFFNDELAVLSGRTQRLADRLMDAIEQRSFCPYYQPQFDARSGSLRGVEILCRWYDDELGWVSPGEFLKVAEEFEVVSKIDEILLDQVAGDLERALDLGISVPRVSFNVTVDRLLKSGLANELYDKIGPHASIAVELLESMSLDDPPDSLRWAIDELREYNIEIEIDDFGSDRASLAGLMAINPNAMKIDRSIVIPIVESARHLDLVKKIIDIGAALNIEVVAEGVETEDHAERLSALGCSVLQGFGLAKPMPFEDFVAFCNRKFHNANVTAVA